MQNVMMWVMTALWNLGFHRASQRYFEYVAWKAGYDRATTDLRARKVWYPDVFLRLILPAGHQDRPTGFPITGRLLDCWDEGYRRRMTLARLVPWDAPLIFRTPFLVPDTWDIMIADVALGGVSPDPMRLYSTDRTIEWHEREIGSLRKDYRTRVDELALQSLIARISEAARG